jgi:hypothetical protein
MMSLICRRGPGGYNSLLVKCGRTAILTTKLAMPRVERLVVSHGLILTVGIAPFLLFMMSGFKTDALVAALCSPQ